MGSITNIVRLYQETYGHQKIGDFRIDTFFRKKKAELRALLSVETKPDYPSGIFPAILDFLTKFFEEFKSQTALKEVSGLVAERCYFAIEYIKAVEKKFNRTRDELDSIYNNVSNTDNLKSTLQRDAYLAIKEKFLGQCKTQEHMLRYEWDIDKAGVEKMIERLYKRVSKEDLVRCDNYYYVCDNIARELKVSSASEKFLKRSKLEWDIIEWFDKTYQILVDQWSTKALEKNDSYRQFDFYGMIVVMRTSIETQDVSKYIKLIERAYVALKNKGFEKAWYGNILVYGSATPDTRGLVNGYYFIGGDYVEVHNPPNDFVTEIIVHELGHRYWYKSMTQGQRGRFESFIRVHKKRRPNPSTPDTHGGISLFRPDYIESLTNGVDGHFDHLLRIVEDNDNKPSVQVKKELMSNTSLLADTPHTVIRSLSELIDTFTVRLDDTFGVSRAKAIEYFKSEINHLWWFFHGSNLELVTKDETKTEWVSLVKQKLAFGRTQIKEFIKNTSKIQNIRIKEQGKEWAEWVDSYDNDPNKVAPVSDYGTTNISEAFAEAFAHYVLDMGMTSEQRESFRSVLKTAKKKAPFKHRLTRA